jgi:glycosyltransferase involved in cell wall biosynthesis
VKWGLPAEKFTHVTNGIEIRHRPPTAAVARRARNRFGFFGQLVDVKGVHVILEAVGLLRAEGFEDFTVDINGDNIQFATPKRREEIQEFLDEEKKRPRADQRVTFNGSYHPDQLAARMARIDWCIVPSVWWEIFCLVISEAWSFGRPVIASNAGGPAERISDGVDGLLFELGDASALAETMRRACTEEGLWERLVAGIKAPPARGVMVAGYLDVYRGLLSAARLAAA